MISVEKFKKRKHTTSPPLKGKALCLGYAIIRYHKMCMQCEVIKGLDSSRPYWFRIPQLTYLEKGKPKKINVISWDTKEDSDNFQFECLMQFMQKFAVQLIERKDSKIKS